jgi:hypothetical protein
MTQTGSYSGPGVKDQSERSEQRGVASVRSCARCVEGYVTVFVIIST